MRATADGMKVCTKCRLNREVAWFSKHKRHANGLQIWCKECNRAGGKARYRRLKETHWKTIAMTGTKKCPKCGEIKEVSLFSPDATNKDGRHSQCNVCHTATDKASKRKRFERDPEFYLINKREIKNMSYRRGGWVVEAENYVNRQRENR